MKYRLIGVLIVFASVLSSSAIDRNAFTFTHYNLDVRVEPEQQRLAVRGRVTLRNDSAAPQKNTVLQISSSLDWRSIRVDGKPVQFVSQPYTSDIDHTGALSEAIVTLPTTVPPKGTVDIDVGYEGVIPLDTTRLKRIGVPEDVAKHSDWDQISPTFTAVRGVGYVVWYPVAMDAANLSNGNSAFEILGRWKARHSASSMNVTFASTAAKIEFSGTPSLFTIYTLNPTTDKYSVFGVVQFGTNVPTFVIPNGAVSETKRMTQITYGAGHDSAAKEFATLAAKIDSFAEQFGRGGGDMHIFDLPDANAAPFVTESMVLMPLTSPPRQEDEQALVYAFARKHDLFRRAWCTDGLAHFEQAAYIEQQSGRQAAIDYMRQRLPIVREAGNSSPPPDSMGRSLIDCSDEAFCGVKAMYVWWMLRDMLGRPVSLTAQIGYNRDQDLADPTYVQHAIEKSFPTRNLQWFFDDWVYHDRGLPDFRVASVYPSKTPRGIYLVTVTIENLGNAGAEVPFTVRFNAGEVTKRLQVRAKSHATTRVEVPAMPTDVVVNDGSVPESNTANNTFTVADNPK